MQYSIAQDCNDDVLLEVLRGLSSHDLTSAACLCHSWLHASRTLLYRHIHLNTSIPAATQLDWSLRSSSHLRSLVRYLVLLHRFTDKDTLLGWIALLPEHSLVSVKFEWMPLDVNPMSLLQFPAIRTAQELIISHPYFLLQEPRRLSDILSYPRLDRLTLFIPKSISVQLSTPLALTRLSLAVLTGEQPQIVDDVLRSISHPLVHLDLLLQSLNAEAASWLRSSLARHLPALRHFTIKVLDQRNAHPLLDDVSASLASVEVLSCGVAMYSPRLFALLPPSLRSLTLGTRDHELFPVAELSDAVSRLGSGGGRLRSLTIGRHPSYASYRYFDALSSTCATLGVSFKIAKPRIADHFL
ncbi:hypothetical protein PsYK624_102340 [Phanerochaete sordida]|uniref:F-box domain-containing protein n=1 Tax=Phanerochaete sordida TaxID=48140 RepID=A0A9P3GFX8_9APHY|nr:hypothetical protein PsYK624_102340 [Phanerochaete sordida]